MGKLNFHGYLISRFFPTCEIRENLMHAKNVCFTVYSTSKVPTHTAEDPVLFRQI